LLKPSPTTAQSLNNLVRCWPSPNDYRGADGAPGPKYWQQNADYVIECTLDVDNQRLDGSELITYRNNSPNTLRYIWLQLDENQHAADANNHKI
jgi:hypothetical protein